jgi:processive 1,2-diacylglycerol beta-glucosyltransferase
MYAFSSCRDPFSLEKKEERNSDHFLEEGVAMRCNDIPVLAYKIDKLLSDKERLLSMREAVRRFAFPNAASDIVSILLRS